MKFDYTQSIPLLILGDAPESKTGLGRIGQDLAWLFSSMPEFRVGYLGRGGVGRSKYPWVSYSYPEHTGQWGERYLQTAWEDLSRGKRGVIFTVWDATRLLWFSQPVGLPRYMQEFLEGGNFERWGYFMQDGAGVGGGLPCSSLASMSGYGRVLLASKWACEMARRSNLECDWLPHGVNLGVFKPLDRVFGRSAWNVPEDAQVVGCCMTNQERKHWSTVMEAISLLPKVRLWAHTDRLMGYWNLTALVDEFGLADRAILDERDFSDAEMAMRYSACDATLVVSGGEGFCYPAAESLACGAPVVSGEYGAQAELIDSRLRVPAAYSRLETAHNVGRSYYRPADVAEALSKALAGETPTRALVEHLDWSKIGVQWKRWAREGIRCN